MEQVKKKSNFVFYFFSFLVMLDMGIDIFGDLLTTYLYTLVNQCYPEHLSRVNHYHAFVVIFFKFNYFLNYSNQKQITKLEFSEI